MQWTSLAWLHQPMPKESVTHSTQEEVDRFHDCQAESLRRAAVRMARRGQIDYRRKRPKRVAPLDLNESLPGYESPEWLFGFRAPRTQRLHFSQFYGEWLESSKTSRAGWVRLLPELDLA
jgi:hypothetical protein